MWGCCGDASCAFCDASSDLGFDVVLEGEDVVVFRDRSPSAKEHLLAIPRGHRGSVKTLTAADVPMIRNLHRSGIAALDSLGFAASSQRFGFHIPPFSSVPHLHLHCIGLPFRSRLRASKYRAAGYWFVGVDEAVAILERGGQVRAFR